MEVDPRSTPLKLDHLGTAVYFCSEGCLRRFRDDPTAFPL